MLSAAEPSEHAYFLTELPMSLYELMGVSHLERNSGELSAVY